MKLNAKIVNVGFLGSDSVSGSGFQWRTHFERNTVPETSRERSIRRWYGPRTVRFVVFSYGSTIITTIITEEVTCIIFIVSETSM